MCIESKSILLNILIVVAGIFGNLTAHAADPVDINSFCSTKAQDLVNQAWIAQPMNMGPKNTADPIKAENLYRQALDESPRCLRALRLMVGLLIRDERYEHAYEYNELSLAIFPHFLGSLGDKAYLLSSWKEDYSQAITIYRQVLLITGPGNGSTYHSIARVYSKMNRIDDSLHYLKLAISVDKGWANSANAQQDDGFENLRKDKRFWDLVKEG